MTLNDDTMKEEPRKPNLHKYAKLTTIESIIYFLTWGLPLFYVSWKSSLIKKRRGYSRFLFFNSIKEIFVYFYDYKVKN